jgi:hypothetical protein
MNIGELMVIGLLLTGAVGAMSLGLYARLPRTALELAEKHGRYSGLGTIRALTARTASNSSVPPVGSLQGQSA